MKLLVGSSKGCLDTISHQLTISDKPPLQLTNDTLICSIDTLRLNAVGVGTFSWSPNYNINNLTINNPLVSPDIPTTYYVTLTLAPGCFNTDSVKVDVKDVVTILPMSDTTICRGDPVTLRPVSDGLYYSWSPRHYLQIPILKMLLQLLLLHLQLSLSFPGLENAIIAQQLPLEQFHILL